MYNVPWSTTPGKLSLSCHGENDSVAFYTPECIGLPNLHEISELNPFNLSAYGPLPNCLRLKTDVTICPPRLVTSEWLVLSRRESHPLSDTTYARSLQESRLHPLHSTKLLTTMNFNRAYFKRIQVFAFLVLISLLVTTVVPKRHQFPHPLDQGDPSR